MSTTTYTVIHPGGTFVRNSSRHYGYAIIRRNRGTQKFFVNLAADETKALTEARVHAEIRDHIDVVPFVDAGQAARLALGRGVDDE